MQEEQPELVTVGWAYGPSEAALAAALLGGDGIEVFPDLWYTMTVRWDLIHAFGGAELRVPSSQAGRALEILADLQVTPRRKHRLLRLLVAALVLFWIGLPPPSSGFVFAGARPVPARGSVPAGNP